MSHYDDEINEREKQYCNELRAKISIQMKRMSNDEIKFMAKVAENVDEFLRLHEFLKRMLKW
jgi:hypothetical protein